MIKSFRCSETRLLYETGKTRRWSAIINVVTRKLVMLDSAAELNDLGSPPGNMLKELSGDRSGQHSIRVNGQYRICFRWGIHGPENVEIVDYH